MSRSLFVIFVLAAFLFALPDKWSGFSTSGSKVSVPPVRLISPDPETLKVNEDPEIEFVWDTHMCTMDPQAYFDLRTYKGRRSYAGHLMSKEKVPSRKHSIRLKDGSFDPGNKYAWSLRMVVPGAGKGPRSENSFKIVN